MTVKISSPWGVVVSSHGSSSALMRAPAAWMGQQIADRPRQPIEAHGDQRVARLQRPDCLVEGVPAIGRLARGLLGEDLRAAGGLEPLDLPVMVLVRG
jgi:hypothetical protein